MRAAGWPAALVTNTGRALTELALDVIGREHFAVTVCGDEVPAGKPDPDPYLRAADLLGVSAADCLAVEDSPTGALAAERAGAGVLVVPCEVPVPGGPGRVLRESLVGLTAADVPTGTRFDPAAYAPRDDRWARPEVRSAAERGWGETRSVAGGTPGASDPPGAAPALPPGANDRARQMTLVG